ncbi:hypothetical protein ACLUEY_14815 [Vreelandella aquamarina]
MATSPAIFLLQTSVMATLAFDWSITTRAWLAFERCPNSIS